MKMQTSIKGVVLGVAATALLTLTATTASAQALGGEITLRPLTPQNITDYHLTGAQKAAGISTIGVGTPAYLDALVSLSFPASNIVDVAWTLTSKPGNSSAVITNSPLGVDVPIYKPTQRLEEQLAGRALLRPDVTGQYVVTATITTTTGSTNLTQTITAGTYMGVSTCALCHSGGQIADNIYDTWVQTPHATAFAQAIDGLSTDHFSQNCISCHVVGFDTNPLAVNDGWDDIAASTGWTFPAHATNGNFAAMPEALRNVSNIQCESCHGPGSEHAFSLGKTNLISVSLGAGDCSQCHDSLTHHYKSAEWNNSGHAAAPDETAATCSRCHTAQGFVNFVNGAPAVNVSYEGITCAACHDPHDASKPHQLRKVNSVTLMDTKTVITNGGAGLICMDCHMSRQNATNYVEVTAGSNRFGPHHGPQTDMLMGVNAVTYGKAIPSSAHRDVVGDACVECHMQDVATTNAAFTHAGGHTFAMSFDNGTNTIEIKDACIKCHGQIDSFDFARQDYDGDGVVNGVQTEVKGLLDELGRLLPPMGSPTVTITSSYTKQQLRAAFNYQFVKEDGSYGIHNLSYAVGLLKASIADLTGDGNGDGLPDAWQIQYFGSTGSSNAAPNATPAGDGIPNWLKYSLGLNPMVAGVTLPDGVVWANGSNVVNPNDPTNSTVKIYTAAEVAFDTVVGKTYQIQGASSLSAGWNDIGTPIAGTGASISYVTPTRGNLQMFFRVVTTP